MRRTDSRLRIIVCGYVVRCPLGGSTWAFLQYAKGLSDLGHEVYYIEESGHDVYCCYNPATHVSDRDPSYGLSFVGAALEKLGLSNKWGYYDHHTDRWLGPCADQILGICSSADMLINVSGVDSLRPWLLEIPTRVLIDMDPAFTQVQNLSDSGKMEDTALYTSHFSYGENIERGISNVPEDGFEWKATRPPIVLPAWPVSRGHRDSKFTTVMMWQSYGTCEYDGIHYGVKADSFPHYLELPSRVTEHMEMAVGGPNTPNDRLLAHDWKVTDPMVVTRDLSRYQDYIQRSKAEFSVAKHAYVISNSGWLSDRSAAYLASGRPVVLQDTGFSTFLDTGAGLVSFNDIEQAIAAIDEVSSQYQSHCDAARDIAEQYFDASKVLSYLIERVA